MSSNIISHEEAKATRLMRRAILHELYCPHGPNDAPPADMLQQVARLCRRRGRATSPPSGRCSTASTERRWRLRPRGTIVHFR